MSTRGGSDPPSMAASSTTRSTPSGSDSGSTAAPGNVHATLSSGQNSQLFTVFESSGLRTQNGGYHFTPGPSTRVYNGPAQGSGQDNYSYNSIQTRSFIIAPNYEMGTLLELQDTKYGKPSL